MCSSKNYCLYEIIFLKLVATCWEYTPTARKYITAGILIELAICALGQFEVLFLINYSTVNISNNAQSNEV